ncbi:uncharacterized protein LOC132551523 [Ylistrum balloti]|uniref:uncharacterized protein LOC132551523 n=1 Tax=Ylistrum balloti TaxID=509963 RepID=UPI002905A75D|nr:uncharacterized protein LOC132551523 [Ylistrum balloti]
MNDDFIFPNTFYQNVQTVAPPSSFYDNNTVTRPTDTSIPQKDFNLCLLGVVVLLLVIVYFCCKENGEFSKIPNSNDEKYTQAKEGNGEQTKKHKQAHKEEDDEISEKHREGERQNSAVKRKWAVESEKQAKRRKEEESKQQAERRKEEESKQQAERRKQEEGKQQAERRKQEESKQQAERRKQEESKQQAERRKQEESKQQAERRKQEERQKRKQEMYRKFRAEVRKWMELGYNKPQCIPAVLSWTPLIGQQLAEQVTKSVEDKEMKDDLSHANLSAGLFLLLNKVHSSNSSNSARMQAGSRKLTENEILMCKSKVSRLVGGTFVTVWFYESCEHVELTFQRFTSVSVPVPDLPQPVHINTRRSCY